MRNCIAALGCPAGKIIVHHLGVKLDQFPYRPRIWQPGEPLRILIAATFTQKKGIPYALEALGRLLQRQQVEVTLIGDARPGVAESLQEKRRILAAIDRFGLASRVRLLGYRPHSIMIEEAYRHHVFLAPSVTAENGATEGGAPVSIIEMAATGMPVVSTRHCDIPEVIQDRVTGLLADERDVTGLVECLEQLLAARESWRPMLDAGRRHMEAQYDAAIQGRRLAQTYEETVA